MFCAFNKLRWFWWVWLLGLSPGLHAEQLDVRVLIDISEEMHQRDQQDLRRAALKTLINQLPTDAHGSIWGYATYTQRFTRHTQTSAMWKQVAGIHIDNLSSGGKSQNPENALTKTLWDLTAPDRNRIHLVWVSNGQIALDTQDQIALSRQNILEQLGNQLASNRVVVHTMAIGPPVATDDLAMLNQISEMTGGLHRVVADLAEAEAYGNALVRLFQTHTEAVIDARGRFQVAPGTQRFTVMWPAEQETTPGLITPDGEELNRLTALPAGRWLLDQTFEMATIEKPLTGWWTLTGPPPTQVGLIGDINLKVSGLRSPVVPSEETAVLLELFHHGEQLTNQHFLDLLDVRVWLRQGSLRQALPTERIDAGFKAYFVHLDDGAYELEAEVVGPTFTARRVLPFQAKNPLRIEVRSDQTGAVSAWISFSHAQVNYATVRASAKVRKPPHLGVIVPGQSLPSGLWQVTLPDHEGIVEVAFTLGGNYINGDGFFLKTHAINLTLPMPPGSQESFRFDAEGKKISDSLLAEEIQHEAAFESSSEPRIDAVEAVESEPIQPAEPEPVLLPWWFVAAISLVTLIAVALVWWFFRPLPLALPEAASSDAALSGQELSAPTG